LPRDPFKAIVAPRPIGWISTRSLDGRINLAPYSFFNACSAAPPIVGFSSEGLKDSASFARESGEFVANLASHDLMQAINATSAPLPRGQNEFEYARLTMAPSRLARAPRVAESRAAMECKAVELVRRGARPLPGARRSRRLPYRRRAHPRRPLRHRRRAAAGALRLSGLRGGRRADRPCAPAGRGEARQFVTYSSSWQT
jgi:flavin reductase (DIM6/NTAB) family NADH-FMN oxidoreductase RutF